MRTQHRATLDKTAMRSHTDSEEPALVRSHQLLGWTIVLTLAALSFYVPSRSPGDIIRLELQAAAAEFDGQLLPTPSAAVLAAMRRDFYFQDVSIAIASDTTTAVTLHGLARGACIDARAKAKRLEGRSVITLRGFRTAEDCQNMNDMTWWIMP